MTQVYLTTHLLDLSLSFTFIKHPLVLSTCIIINSPYWSIMINYYYLIHWLLLTHPNTPCPYVPWWLAIQIVKLLLQYKRKEKIYLLCLAIQGVNTEPEGNEASNYARLKHTIDASNYARLRHTIDASNDTRVRHTILLALSTSPFPVVLRVLPIYPHDIPAWKPWTGKPLSKVIDVIICHLLSDLRKNTNSSDFFVVWLSCKTVFI